MICLLVVGESLQIGHFVTSNGDGSSAAAPNPLSSSLEKQTVALVRLLMWNRTAML
jgi:hypothetical protein